MLGKEWPKRVYAMSNQPIQALVMFYRTIITPGYFEHQQLPQILN